MATLRFGERARRLKTKPRIHVLDDTLSGQSSKSELINLRRALTEARSEIYRLSEVIADMSRPSRAASRCNCNRKHGSVVEEIVVGA